MNLTIGSSVIYLLFAFLFLWLMCCQLKYVNEHEKRKNKKAWSRNAVIVAFIAYFGIVNISLNLCWLCISMVQLQRHN